MKFSFIDFACLLSLLNLINGEKNFQRLNELRHYNRNHIKRFMDIFDKYPVNNRNRKNLLFYHEEGTERINASDEFKQKKIIDTQSATIMKHHIRHRPDLNGQEIYWPVKKEALVEGNLVLGGLMMVHEREDSVTCGPIMPQGGIQALEAMLYTLDRINNPLKTFLPNITIGAHILDDCDKDTYGLEMAVDFIKGKNNKIMIFLF